MKKLMILASLVFLGGCGSTGGGDDSPTSSDKATVACAEGTICKGSSRADVLKILGRPDAVSSETERRYETWDWDESDREKSTCGISSHLCFVLFEPDGTYRSNYNVNPKFIDIMNQ